MDVTSALLGKRLGNDQILPPELDIKQVFFTNLQLLGFDAAAMEMKYKIPFTKEMFNLPNKAGAEAVLYFLFNRLNPTMCRQHFRDCWPVIDKKTEAAFRKLCCIWLQTIQKEEVEARLPRINAALFLSPVGDKFYQLLFSFSTYVMLHVMHRDHGLKGSAHLSCPNLTMRNKDLGVDMETTLNCAAIRHRKQFMGTLGQMMCVKQSWGKYTDALTRSYRSLAKEKREVERRIREEVQTAAEKGQVRGSPVPASRRPQDFELSATAASRAQRIQHVRGMWSQVEGFLEQSKEQQEIVNSIIDKTLEKHTIDSAKIHISIPHLMLRECEQEMRRRQVENIYEGGDLNLLSVVQLWNMALRMYIKRLKQGGLKDLSTEAKNMRVQSHSHHAYLASASHLREKLKKEIPRQKKTIAKLRGQFLQDNVSGVGLSAPSPPMYVDPSRSQVGSTPTDSRGHIRVTPVARVEVDSPEAAKAIADSLSVDTWKAREESYTSQSLGRSSLSDWNRNNSARLPQPTQRSGAGKGGKERRPQSSSLSSQGRAGIQPRVVRHFSRQAAAPHTSLPKKSAPGKSKGQVSSGRPLASTPEKTLRRKAADLDKTPVPSDCNNSAETALDRHHSSAETARHRAHNILAEQIVQSVMHGEEDGGDDVLPYDLGLTSPRWAKQSTSPSSTFAQDLAVTPLSRSQKRTPSTHAPHSLSSLFDTDLPTVQSSGDDQHVLPTPAHQKKASGPGGQGRDSEHRGKPFARVASPVTLVQQAHRWETEHSHGGGGSEREVGAGHSHTEELQGVRGEEPEAEDANPENPAATATVDSVFGSQDLTYRSPLADFISQMWQENMSDGKEDEDSLPGKDLAADLEDWDRDSVSSAQESATPRGQQSSDNSAAAASPPVADASQEARDLGDQGAVAGGSARGGRSPAWAEARPDSAQTMINSTQAFFTSFDEEELGTEEAHDRTVEWQERLSALYDDEGEVEDGGDRADSQDVIAFNFTLKNGDLGKGNPVPPGSGSGEVVPLPGSVSSPLISFTPAKTLPPQVSSRDRTPSSVTRKEESGLEPSCPSPSDRKKGGVKAGSKTVTFSPEGSSDKENCSAGGQKDDSSLTSSRQLLRDSLQSPFLKNGAGSGDGAVAVEEVLDEEDILDASGASPLDESFTPLRSGLLVQGTPTRPTLKDVSGGLFPQRGTSPHAEPSGGQSTLDEKLAAQLNRLKKLKSEAFAGLNLSESDGQQEHKKVTSSRADASFSSLLSASCKSETDSREKQSATISENETGPLDIFGEDDSILLPPSP